VAVFSAYITIFSSKELHQKNIIAPKEKQADGTAYICSLHGYMQVAHNASRSI